jgi:hypothetical protein
MYLGILINCIITLNFEKYVVKALTKYYDAKGDDQKQNDFEQMMNKQGRN